MGHSTIRAEAAAVMVWGLADLVVFQLQALAESAAGWFAATTSFGGGVMALVPATAVGTSVVGATGLVTAGSAVWAADSGCLDPLFNWTFSNPTPRNLPNGGPPSTNNEPTAPLNSPNRVPVPEGHTRAYRAVSEAEYQDIIQTGGFRQGPNSMEGKWFSDTPEGAILHGDALEGVGNYRLIEVDIPNNAPSLHLDPNLDLRGPARYLDASDLVDLVPRLFGG